MLCLYQGGPNQVKTKTNAKALAPKSIAYFSETLVSSQFLIRFFGVRLSIPVPGC